MPLPFRLVLALAMCGHIMLWISFLNHINATALSRRLLKIAGLGTKLWLVVGTVWLIDRVLAIGLVPIATDATTQLTLAEWFYVSLTSAVALVGLPYSFMRRRAAAALRCCETAQGSTELFEMGGRPLGPNAGLLDHLLALLPGNQVWSVEVVRRHIAIDGLAPELDGLTIVHLSDLHFTGRVDRSYFVRVVELINQMDPDVIAITGDVVDRADCLSWIPATLGQLRSRHGSFFVLGNHDGKVGHDLVRAHLREAGLSDVGGQCRRVSIHGRSLLVAGNELPWCAPAADPIHFAGDKQAPLALRLLLSHSGDQLRWARRHGFQLMLAGHSHGGQIRLPGLGALVCPIRDSLQMAAGLFHTAETTLHVSRGISAEVPIRLNCRPEITQLVLHPVTTQRDGDQTDSYTADESIATGP
jgi:predicted MPP superfamily phosphohydrolase